MSVSNRLTTMDDSVTFINSIVDGTYTDNPTWSLDDKKIVVSRNKEFLEKQLLSDDIIADDTDKTPYNDAITAANTFLQD